MATQVDLFGTEVEVAESASPGEQPPVNDMAVIESVLTTAIRSGFVLAGANQRVYRWQAKHEVGRVPSEVAHAVHQLITARWLTVGGTRQARMGACRLPVRSVLVPTKTRRTVQRWQNLHNPWH